MKTHTFIISFTVDAQVRYDRHVAVIVIDEETLLKSGPMTEEKWAKIIFDQYKDRYSKDPIVSIDSIDKLCSNSPESPAVLVIH